tara:strand:+ start:195 stop:449 length:255 start_codon:yes stop_codon:yes gene_type:complete
MSEFKTLVNMDKFDFNNKVLVESTIKDLWGLQDAHESELDNAWLGCDTDNETLELRSKIKQRIKDTDNDLDILCKMLWGDLNEE